MLVWENSLSTQASLTYRKGKRKKKNMRAVAMERTNLALVFVCYYMAPHITYSPSKHYDSP